MLTFQCLLKKQLTPQTSLLKHPSNFTFAKASTIFLLNQLNQNPKPFPWCSNMLKLTIWLVWIWRKSFRPFSGCPHSWSNQLLSYGNKMEKLLNHDLVTDKVLVEWASFKEIVWMWLFVSKFSGQENSNGNRPKCNKPFGKIMERVYTSCIFQCF